MSMFTRPLLAAAVLAVVCQASWAQSAGPGAAPSDSPARHELRHKRMHERMGEHQAKALDQLKSRLALQADQAPAWNSFAQAMQLPPQPPARMDAAGMEKLTTPERIERMQAFKLQRDAEMQKRQQATQTFYASLNTEQKKVFDEQTQAWMQQHMGAHGQPVRHRGGHRPDPGYLN